MIGKIISISLLLGLLFGVVIMLLTATGSYFTIIQNENLEENIPRHFTMDDDIVYDALFLGVFPIIVESKKEVTCSVAMIDGPMTKVKREGNLSGTIKDHEKFHLQVERISCVN
jgi:hypothetical protein